MPGLTVDTSAFCDSCANAWARIDGLTIPSHRCDGGADCECLTHLLDTESHTSRPITAALLAGMPRYEGRGCSWDAAAPTRCTTHGAELVLLPVMHSTGGEANQRLCRTALAEAAAVPTPEPPRPTVARGLLAAIDTDPAVADALIAASNDALMAAQVRAGVICTGCDGILARCQRAIDNGRRCCCPDCSHRGLATPWREAT